MRVKCPGCKKFINIKEGSYPKDKNFSFSCPGCSFKISVKTEKREESAVVSENKNHLYGEKLKQEIVSKNTSLPPIPDVLKKVKDLLNDPNSSPKDISKVIALDQGISARVLKLANSAYFNFNPPIPTITEACVLLGEDNIMSIIMVAEMSKMLDKELIGYEIPTGNLFYHCIAVAVAASHISNEKMPLFDQDSFSAGLLHDCGKLILNEYVNERKEEFLEMIKENGLTCYEAETMMFGFSHADIGFELLESWKLPEIQTHSIGYHHHPVDSDGNELAYILNVADYIAIQAGFTASSYCGDKNLTPDKDVLDFLDLEEFELSEYIEIVKEKVNEMTKDFSF